MFYYFTHGTNKIIVIIGLMLASMYFGYQMVLAVRNMFLYEEPEGSDVND